mmetsp:Transcript_50148/g.160605  ORF Transcript_50148/g.160605 Transcript_50148/m.160605 type:complete len:222 (+) Transcript_50148:2988-3653(+)
MRRWRASAAPSVTLPAWQAWARASRARRELSAMVLDATCAPPARRGRTNPPAARLDASRAPVAPGPSRGLRTAFLIAPATGGTIGETGPRGWSVTSARRTESATAKPSRPTLPPGTGATGPLCLTTPPATRWRRRQPSRRSCSESAPSRAAAATAARPPGGSRSWRSAPSCASADRMRIRCARRGARGACARPAPSGGSPWEAGAPSARTPPPCLWWAACA